MYTLFDDLFYNRRPSVYVISDSQLAEWKREQAEKEITELNKLIDGHKQSIERLEATVEGLRREYPQLPTTEDNN